MPRPKEDRIPIMARLKPEDRERLGKRIIELGFVYSRGGKDKPAWTAFLEAVSRDEILLYKKVSQGG